MAESPFYIVKAKNKNVEVEITEYIDSFVFEDCVEKDDILRLSIKNGNVDIVDTDWLTTGTELHYKFGYIGGLQSAVKLAVITNIRVSFAHLISIEIEALDKGNVMKKTESNKVWKGMTASQIATEIAKYYNLKPVVNETSFVYTSLPQGNRTDFEFLKYLTMQEKNGSFHSYIKNDELHFEKKDLSKKAFRKYTYGEGSEVIGIGIDYRETQQNRAGLETSVNNYNPLTGEFKQINKNPLNVGEDGKLGKEMTSYLQYDGNAKSQKGKVSTKPNQSDNEKQNNVFGKLITTPPTMSPIRMDNLASGLNKQNKQKELVITLGIEGDATLKTDEIITLAGIGKKFSGNYYCSKITHRIGSGGNYITNLELQKNAVNKPISTQNTGVNTNNVNNSEGTKSKDDKRIIPNYDANSNRVK